MSKTKIKGTGITVEKGAGIVETITRIFGSVFHFKTELMNSDGTGSDHYAIHSLDKTTGESKVVGTSRARLALPVKTGTNPETGGNIYKGDAKRFGTQMIDAIMPVASALESKGFTLGAYGDLGIGLWVDNHYSRAAIMFRHPNIVEEVKVGDAVGFGVVARFGIDGGLKQTVQAYHERLACSNGMTTRSTVGGYEFSRKHTIGFAGHAAGIMNGLDTAINNFASTNAQFRKLVGKKVSAEHARKVIEEALGKRAANDALESWGRGRGQDGDLDAWNLLNTVTERLSDSFHARPGQPDSIEKAGNALEALLALD